MNVSESVRRSYAFAKETYLSLGKIRRFVLFFSRAALHARALGEIYDFFDENELRRGLLAGVPSFIEFIPRRLFYAGSTLRERCALMKFHFRHLEKTLAPEAIRAIYELDGSRGATLWTGDFEEGKKVSFRLAGLRKEGLFSLELCVDDAVIYNVNAWIAGTREDASAPALWIGAMQGSNAENAAEIIKRLAKHFASYRPKNLVVYVARALARALGCAKIYAVSNAGFYANNGIRIDRKLKTNLDEFWPETDGFRTDDRRFFELPLVEPRKSLEEMKPNKRSMYRKRFKLLDAFDADVAAAVAALKKQERNF